MRYRAFICYSHRDEVIARWIHRQLEAWPVARELIGRITLHGEVPATLRPIFRDRDDFAGGASLTEATVAALRDSECLVLLCSPHAAASAYVNEEVRLFMSFGRRNRIIPIIVAGDPRDPQQNCFPPALWVAQDANGSSGATSLEPIAADAREGGDGRARAVAKVVAGLLGVDFDEIARRAEQAKRKRIAAFTGIGSGAFLFATVLSSYALYQSYQANVAIDRSLFALGGVIRRVDSIDPDGELGAMRAEMLMTQCDILQGLARGRSEPEIDKETMCLSERARVLAERQQSRPALAFMSKAADDLSKRIREQDEPSYALRLALLRALDDSYTLSAMNSPTDSETWLDRLLHAAEETTRAWPEQAELRVLHDSVMQRKFELLYTRRDWPALQDLLERSIGLRNSQAESLVPEHASASRFEHASYQLTLAALHHGELGQPDVAIDLAESALQTLAALAEQTPADHVIALQRIRALNFLSTANGRGDRKEDSQAHVDVALQLLAVVLQNSALSDEERGEAMQLQQQLQSAAASSEP